MGTPRIEVGDVFVQDARQMPLVDEVARLIRWFGLLVFLFLAAPAGAATIPATSCSDAHVQSAINTAAAGDTVTVPAGNCTWTTTVTVTSKRLVLQGAGINVTTITDQATGANALTISGASATNFVRVTGFTFIKGTSHPDGMIQLFGTEASVAFRIHHIRLVMATAGSRGIYPVAVYGLIDHNTFDITAASGSIQVISIDGSHAGADGGFTPWTRPLTLGTVNAVYIEDNVFNVVTIDEDSIDAYAGARFVVRYNTFNGAHIGFHGTDSGSMRSPVSHEVYNNTFINNSGGTFRGGTVWGGGPGSGSATPTGGRVAGRPSSSCATVAVRPATRAAGSTAMAPAGS
jgi:hypothetical protein